MFITGLIGAALMILGSWAAVWILYIWNRFRVLLAQLPANILSEELSRYPVLEREMMRANLSLPNIFFERRHD